MRTLLWTFVFMLWSHEAAWASSWTPLVKEGHWVKTTRDCEVWRGKKSPNLVATWSGWCDDGKVNGSGVLTYEYDEDGKRVTSRYEGEMLGGKPNGRGELVKPNGTRYEGEFRDGWTHGHGVAVYESGERYEGQFADGFPHGHGIMTYPTGDRHEGKFIDGIPQGHGSVVYPNGDRYEGEFSDGAPHGNGKYIWQRGNSFEGEFFYGLPHGIGQCRNGSKSLGCEFLYGDLTALRGDH